MRTLKKYLLAAGITTIILAGGIQRLRQKEKRKSDIHQPEGIDWSGLVELNGSHQYLQIRGQKQTNPLMIYLHGGPGTTYSPISYKIQQDLEGDFTLIHWDQRAVGRSHFYSQDRAKAPSLDQLIKDLDQLIQHLKVYFNQDQVFLLGHSWGSVIGVSYCQAFPENVAAYIGVSQVTNLMQSDRWAVHSAAKKANNNRGQKFVKKMKKFQGEILEEGRVPVKEFISYRAFCYLYLPFVGGKSALKLIAYGLISPQAGWLDYKWYLMAALNLNFYNRVCHPMLLDLFTYHWQVESLDMPAFFIFGQWDTLTPVEQFIPYFQQLHAPNKALKIMEGFSHNPMIDDPQAFAQTIKRLLASSDLH